MKKIVPSAFSGPGADIESRCEPAGPSDGLIYFGCADGNLCCYDFQTRKSKVVACASGGVGAIAAFDGKLYYGYNELCCYDPKTGKSERVAEGHATDYITVFDGGIYYGIDLWRYHPRFRKSELLAKRDDIINCATAFKGCVYYGADNLYRYNPRTRKSKRVAKVRGQRPIRCIAELGGELYYGSEDRFLYRYNPKTGKSGRVAEAEGWIMCATSFNGRLYLGDSQGNLYQYSPFMSDWLKPVAKAGKWIYSITEFKGNIYFGSDDGLYVYSLKTGASEVVDAGSCIHGIAAVPTPSKEQTFNTS